MLPKGLSMVHLMVIIHKFLANEQAVSVICFFVCFFLNQDGKSEDANIKTSKWDLRIRYMGQICLIKFSFILTS